MVFGNACFFRLARKATIPQEAEWGTAHRAGAEGRGTGCAESVFAMGDGINGPSRSECIFASGKEGKVE